MLWEKTKITATRESLTGDSIMLRKQYPEWELQVRIPIFAHGRLLWYCNKHVTCNHGTGAGCRVPRHVNIFNSLRVENGEMLIDAAFVENTGQIF